MKKEDYTELAFMWCSCEEISLLILLVFFSWFCTYVIWNTVLFFGFFVDLDVIRPPNKNVNIELSHKKTRRNKNLYFKHVRERATNSPLLIMTTL